MQKYSFGSVAKPLKTTLDGIWKENLLVPLSLFYSKMVNCWTSESRDFTVSTNLESLSVSAAHIALGHI